MDTGYWRLDGWMEGCWKNLQPVTRNLKLEPPGFSIDNQKSKGPQPATCNLRAIL